MPETQRHAPEAPARSHRRPATALATLATLLALLSFGASAASADVVRKTSTADITINDAQGGPSGATPFPAKVTVAGQTRSVVGVTVKLDDVTHGYAGDLDVALVGPNGQRVMLMSDNGGSTDLVKTDLTFEDEAPQSLPGSEDIAEGTYKPTDNDFGGSTPDPFPAGAPQDFAARLDVFRGLPANGDWKLYVVDDTGGDGGTIGGWTLTLETGPAPASSTPIAMLDDGSANKPASPYGAPLEISGVQGATKEVSVTLRGVRHDDPGDIDVMLESPDGAVSTLMSDAGGVADVTDRELRFDDDAPSALSDTDPLQSGTYKPTNNQGADAFPAPAPAQTGTAGLSAFEGRDPNGTWKLWVVDDSGGAAGSIAGGWSLEIAVTPFVRFAQDPFTVGEAAGQRSITVSRPEGGDAAAVSYVTDTADREHDVEHVAGSLSFAAGQKSKTFTVNVKDDTGDEPDESVGLGLTQANGDAVLPNAATEVGQLVIEDDDAADVRGDFNGDGRDDVAVGAPGEKVGADAGAGLVNVIYGGAAGLAAAGNQAFTQDSAGVPDATEPGDGFGTAVASGDFNSDGFSDLAVGVPGEELGAAADSGVVTVLHGSASGLTGTGSKQLGQDTASVPGASEAGDRFGAALAAGNFGRTAHSDLAVGQPGEDVGAANGAGALTTLYGSAAGLGGTGAQYFSQDVAGMPETAESADAFGAALAAGGLGLGAEDDLAVGVPGESGARGAVHLVYGDPAAGLELAGTDVYTQDTPDIQDVANPGDAFGAALAISRAAEAGDARLAIGAPQEDIGAAEDAGLVHVLSAEEEDGVYPGASQLLAQSTGTLIDVPEDGDRFGAALAFGNYGAAGAELSKSGKIVKVKAYEDLAVGVPGETLGGVSEAGAAAVLYANDGDHGGDIDDLKNQLWHQNTTGVLDSNHAGDEFGASLATVRNGDADGLAIGVPGEAAGAGAMAVLKGTGAAPLTSDGDQRWRQGLGGILDAAEGGDGFAGALFP